MRGSIAIDRRIYGGTDSSLEVNFCLLYRFRLPPTIMSRHIPRLALLALTCILACRGTQLQWIHHVSFASPVFLRLHVVSSRTLHGRQRCGYIVVSGAVIYSIFACHARTYIETGNALLRDHIVSATLAVLITTAHIVGGVQWLLAGFGEVVGGDFGLNWADE
jgi:ABC-type nitrate/sulfonate/bicarbonate transport system permease component